MSISGDFNAEPGEMRFGFAVGGTFIPGSKMYEKSFSGQRSGAVTEQTPT